MHLTISKKLYGLGLLGLVFTLVVGVTGVWGITEVAAGLDAVSSTSSVIRNHIQASMFIDWSRTDISKMLTSSGDSQDTASSELANHLKLFNDRLSAAISFVQDPAMRATLDKEAALAAEYTSNASRISDLRAKPAEATQFLGPLLQGYRNLRDMIDATNDQLQTDSKNTAARARAVVAKARLTIIVFCIASSVLLLAIAFSITHQINRRLAEIIRKLKLFAEGDLTQQVADARRDELAEMARWFNDSMEKLRGAIARVASGAESILTAVDGLREVSQSMSANSEQTTSQANIVSHNTSKVTDTLQTVATSTEEMNSSIQEIAKNVGQAATVSNDAMQIVTSTNKTVSKLGDASLEIGAVIKVITSIAQQTNLLALNATIEAARAGEAGKGFAIVANEVKELAKQTAKATEDISHKIEAIQGSTAESVEAISKISEIIVQINEISRSVSHSIDEQNATTNQIARNISDGARGSSEIANNISGVALAAQSTSRGAQDVQKATEDLKQMSVRLQHLVGQFKYQAAEVRDGGDHDPAGSLPANISDPELAAIRA
ncbi:MAG TPA: methyl-accepting chemotaxis protein [Candidatus Acidoferrales bacterium]|jgi:methyl-accepting chemotaxis protein|nr:methyl-accepting chemotaxis protein [Candidatus Acidoferrales bacterium]